MPKSLRNNPLIADARGRTHYLSTGRVLSDPNGVHRVGVGGDGGLDWQEPLLMQNESYRQSINRSYQAAFENGYATGYADGFEDGQTSTDTAPESIGSHAPEKMTESIESPELYGFVLVSEVVPDAILGIRYFSTYNFVGERISGYNEPIALLTKEAASALKEASDDLLQQGYYLKVYDAYRPQSAVEHFKTWALDLEDTKMKAYFYPEVDKSVLFAQGYRYFPTG